MGDVETSPLSPADNAVAGAAQHHLILFANMELGHTGCPFCVGLEYIHPTKARR